MYDFSFKTKFWVVYDLLDGKVLFFQEEYTLKLKAFWRLLMTPFVCLISDAMQSTCPYSKILECRSR
uniref:Uncharacterized protein n=1 Tax=Rhizophora mucronata TaxID=61149 RepID=A0A2P2JM65_RHIMU